MDTLYYSDYELLKAIRRRSPQQRYVSLQLLADEAGIGYRTAKNAIKRLRVLGFVKTERSHVKGGRGCVYRYSIIPTVEENLERFA